MATCNCNGSCFRTGRCGGYTMEDILREQMERPSLRPADPHSMTWRDIQDGWLHPGSRPEPREWR